METVTTDRKVQATKIPLKQYRQKLIDRFLSQHRHKLTAEGIREVQQKLMYHIGERGIDKDFRDWLFSQGIMLVRKERMWYLHFFDELESSKFMLMYM